jgi:hypothetical protein
VLLITAIRTSDLVVYAKLGYPLGVRSEMRTYIVSQRLKVWMSVSWLRGSDKPAVADCLALDGDSYNDESSPCLTRCKACASMMVDTSSLVTTYSRWPRVTESQPTPAGVAVQWPCLSVC